jgi:serine/threonine-protein kinase
MLTGNPPHVGSSAQQIIMKIITETAQPVIAHRKSVPRNVAAAVAKALEKLPSDRFESAKAFADALSNPSFQYGDALTSVAGARGHVVRYRDPVTVGLGVFALIATAAALLAMMRPAPPQLVGKYAIALDSTAQLAYRGIGEPARVALTPDGSTVIYVSSRAGRFSALDELLVRPLGSLESRALPGTLGASRPAVSPDGSQVAFLAGPADHASLVVVPLGGGPPLTLADSAIASGPAWGPKGFIFYVTRTGIIRRVAATGGPTEDVVRLPALSGAANYRWLTILPGGHAAIVGIRPGSPTDDAQYLLRSVDFATGQLGATLSGIAAHYVAEARALIYVAPDGSLMAVPFDVSHQKLKGRPQALFTGVSARNGEADLDVAGGMLVYALPGQNGVEHMAWVSRKTGIAQTVDSTWTDTEFESFALSPDGGRLAVTIGGGVATDKSNQSRYDVWLKQLDHGPMSRLSFGGESNTDPSWSGDGKYVSYTSLRGGYGSLWRRRADGVGEEELVADIGRNIIESRWSRDGAWLVVSVSGPPSRDIMAMHLGVDRALRPLLAEAHDEWKPSISPNGQWLAYVSTESGTEQVFVRPFPNVQAGKWQISLSGGTDPVWSADGRELFFRALSRNREPQVLVAELSKGPGLADLRVLITSPRGFEVNPQDRMFDVSPDAQRFMVSVQENDDETGNLVVVHNFIAELRAALASGRAKQ